MKKLFALIMSVLMIACFMPTMAFADVAAPTVSGDEITVTPENAQATLDGQYGSINGKTVVLTAGTYDMLTIGGVTAETKGDITLTCNHTDGTHYSYTNAEDYKAHIAENVFHYTSTYTRTMKNVTLVARGAVTVKGVLITSGHLHQEPNPLREGYTGYYLNQNLTNFTFSGINFVGNVNINTSSEDTVFDGFTFDNCTFTTGGTTSDKGQAIRYYNENNNGKVKNLVVKNCEFNNCYQGVYTMKVNNISVTDCTFNTTGHNAIAVQGEAVNHGAVVITNNIFTGIGDRIIRFNKVGEGTQITISNNTATNSGDKDGEVIKAESLADGITYNVCKNSWGDGKKVGNDKFSEQTAVAKVGNVYYASLQEALETAADGQTVRLIETITLTDNLILDSGKKIQLDLNGKTINIPAQNYVLITHGGIDVVGTGTIDSKNESYAFKLVGSKTDVSDYSTLTIGNNVTVKSEGYGAFVSPYVNEGDGIHNYGTKIIIKGTVESNYGIYVNGQLKVTEGNVPVVNLESGAKLKNAGIYAAGYANWNLAGDIDAPDALSIKSGNIVITGGKYTSTGDFYDPADANGNGSEDTGAALSITSNDGYAKKLNVEVLGGEFTSTNGYAIYEGIAFDKEKNESAAEESFATLAIKGGKFVGNQAKGSVAITTAKNTKVITGGTFSSDPSAYVADNYVAVKSGDTWTVRAKATSSGGSYIETPLEKAKKEANTAISAAASANKYDEAEQAEVKAILDKAAADIKNAKTEEEVKAIQEAAQAEIDKVLTTEEKAQVASVGSVDKDIFKAKSKYSKLNGKKAIKITWNVPEGMKLDGFEVFRSTKKYSGFGKTPYFTTTNTSYTNNKDLVAGKTYYYKVRGFVEINGERYYTGFSTKAFRTIK